MLFPDVDCVLSFRCVIVNAKEAEDKYIALVHTKKHIDLIKNISSEKLDSRRNRMAAKFNSIYFNEGSSEAAYLAAGSVIEVCIVQFSFGGMKILLHDSDFVPQLSTNESILDFHHF